MILSKYVLQEANMALCALNSFSWKINTLQIQIAIGLQLQQFSNFNIVHLAVYVKSHKILFYSN